MPEKMYGMLGLAQRAGKIASGESAAEANIQKQKAKLVIIAEDASEGTKKAFFSLCSYHKAKYLVMGEKIRLGIALGKSPRSVVVILDNNFAKNIAQNRQEE